MGMLPHVENISGVEDQVYTMKAKIVAKSGDSGDFFFGLFKQNAWKSDSIYNASDTIQYGSWG